MTRTSTQQSTSSITKPLPVRTGQADQRGMASIVITMVTMVVISLIVIGFATVSRREQRQSEDQLQSSQAFYAAESGVEDARNAINGWLSANPGATVPSKTTSCTKNDPGVSIYPENAAMTVDQTYNTAYTCLKVNSSPGNLQFNGISSAPVVAPITTANPVTSLKITWKPNPVTGNPSSECPSVPSATNRVFGRQGTGAGAWTCKYGLLRIELVPTNNNGTLTTAGLAGSLLDAALVPTKAPGGGTLAYPAGIGHANVVAADCNMPSSVYGQCSATISAITAGSRTMSLRISSIYQTSNVTVEAFNGATTQGITGAQVEVDSTGRASDVLRRIKVRIPIAQNGGGLLPSSALSSAGSICKRFSASTGYFNVPADIVDPDVPGPSNPQGNQMCQTFTDDATFGP